jgi:hypothetical protein
MRTKKITTTIVEKFNYDDSGINIEPALLLKLLGFARNESKSEEHLYSIVAKTQLLAETTPLLEYEHYDELVNSPKTIEHNSSHHNDSYAHNETVESVVEMPKENHEVMENHTENPPAQPQ